MNREVHVRICGGGGVRFPSATRQRRGEGGVRAVRWGFRKTNASEPPMKCRDLGNDIRTGVSMRSRDEPGGWPLIGQAVSGMQAA